MNKIILEYRSEWKNDYFSEKEKLCSVLKDALLQSHHIGGTAVVGCYTKPIIDILLVVNDLGVIDRLYDELRQIGYTPLGGFGIEDRRFLKKIQGDGIVTHHINVFAKDSKHIQRYIIFRDYLIAHPEIASQFGELKKHLAQKDQLTVDDYIRGKISFIRAHESLAAEWYRRLGL